MAAFFGKPVQAVRIHRLIAGAISFLLLFSQPSGAATAGAESDELLIGFGRANLDLPASVPLAGYSGLARRHLAFNWFKSDSYSFFFQPAIGIHDPIQARAMVLQHRLKRLVFVRLDLIAVTPQLVAALRDRVIDLNISDGSLFVSATHTHSGPGAWINSILFELIATDRYHAQIFDCIVAAAENAVRQAVATAEPGHLYSNTFEIYGLQVNRRDHAAPVDHNVNLLLARSQNGQWLGGLVNFAIHPTALPLENHLLSADIPGAIEKHIETALQNQTGSSDPITMLFINGALGDVAPLYRNFDGIDVTGRTVAEHTIRALPSLREVPSSWDVTSVNIDLGKPGLVPGHCIETHWPVKWLDTVRVPLGGSHSGLTTLQLVRLGDMTLMSWPGEPTSALGLALQQEAKIDGAKQTWIFALTGDYKAYFTTPEEFSHQSGESCSSLFGGEAGQLIIAAYHDMLTSNKK